MYLKLRVTPDSRRDHLERTGAVFHVRVKEPAKQGLANRRALGLLAEHLKVPGRDLRIVSGHRSSQKIVHIRNWNQGL